MIRVKLILFDVGGTLLSSDMQLFKNLSIELKNLSLEPSLKRLFFEKKKKTKGYNFKTITQMLTETAEEYGKCDFNKVLSLHIKSFVDNGEIYPDTLPSLEQLHKRGFKLGIVSDADWNVLKAELEKFGLMKFFSCFSVSSEVKSYKPAKKP